MNKTEAINTIQGIIDKERTYNDDRLNSGDTLSYNYGCNRIRGLSEAMEIIKRVDSLT